MTMTPERFHDLLDEASWLAPPPPPLESDLAAGRTRLGRRRAGVTGAGLVAAAVVAVAVGSVLAGSPEAADEPSRFATDQPSSVATPVTTHERVLGDVIEATFQTPGDGQLRNIRVHTFVRGWGLEQCGGQAAPLGDTAGRFAQNVTPSLSLIRERGFTEPEQEKFDGYDEDCQPGEELQARAPAFEDWSTLAVSWQVVIETALRDRTLLALKAPMAQCLRAATGLEIDDRDPAGSLLGAVDGAGTRGASDQERQTEQAAAYADCGANYFGRLEELLLLERPAYVEQHRELLEEFAEQIAALGYSS
jgi:hypothetical protein